MSIKNMIRTKLATARSKTLYEIYLTKADQAKEDRQKTSRLAVALCKTCFYLLKQPEPTLQKCHGCSTSLSVKEEFCLLCASSRQICRRCGADIDFVQRKLAFLI